MEPRPACGELSLIARVGIQRRQLLDGKGLRRCDRARLPGGVDRVLVRRRSTTAASTARRASRTRSPPSGGSDLIHASASVRGLVRMRRPHEAVERLLIRRVHLQRAHVIVVRDRVRVRLAIIAPRLRQSAARAPSRACRMTGGPPAPSSRESAWPFSPASGACSSRGAENSSVMRSSVRSGAPCARTRASSAGPPAYSDSSANGSIATHFGEIGGDAGPRPGSLDVLQPSVERPVLIARRASAHRLSPTSHTVPFGNTERNVATIDRRSRSLML